MLFTWVTRATSSSSSSSSPVSLKTTDSSLCSFFFFFTRVCIVTTSFDKFELQCQKRFSEINVIVPIRLKFKFYAAVSIKWGSWINFLFMRGQDIVNNWDFPSKISRHCHKRLVLVVWHDQREIFLKMSFRDQLICFADFVGMILLAVLFLLLSPSCFFIVFFPTFFATVLKFFLPLTTSATSGTTNSNKSAPTRFAAGTIFLRKNGIAVLPVTCASAPNPRSCCRPTPLYYGISTCLEATIM